MKVQHSNLFGTIPINDIHYSECFRFVKGTNVCGADPTKLYIRVQTDQRYCFLGKNDKIYPGVTCARGLALEDTVFVCIPLDTRVIPIKARVVMESIEV